MQMFFKYPYCIKLFLVRRNSMRYPFSILIVIFSLSALRGYAQASKSSADNGIDTTIALSSGTCKIKVQLFNPHSEDPDENNATISLINKKGKVLFADSLHMGRLDFWMEDFNGDGVKDIVLHRHMLASRSNMTYNLYLVSKDGQNLGRVIGFDDVLNPTFDSKKSRIKSNYLYGPYMGWSYYKIDKTGRLRKVSRNYKERVK
jgi:hypothetical protein